MKTGPENQTNVIWESITRLQRRDTGLENGKPTTGMRLDVCDRGMTTTRTEFMNLKGTGPDLRRILSLENLFEGELENNKSVCGRAERHETYVIVK